MTETITPTAPAVAVQASKAARISQAVKASEVLAASVKAAATAGASVFVKAYGADVDGPAVRLALAAAREAAGATKSKGGARANVLAVLDTVAPLDALDATAFVAAARVRLDSLAKAKRDRTERKQALAAQVNDSAATPSARAAALEVLAGMDEADSREKVANRKHALGQAALTARAAGITEADALAIVRKAYSGTMPTK